jgi:DNA-binding MarR family transcriptional regulator
MDGRDSRDNIPWLVWQVFSSSKPELYALAELHDLSILQMFAVCVLESGCELPMSSLSGLLHCDASNVTGIVDKLESLSLVTRQESAKDRRIKIIQITPAGLNLARELLEKMRAVSVPNVAGLSPEERETLGRLLMKLVPARE